MQFPSKHNFNKDDRYIWSQLLVPSGKNKSNSSSDPIEDRHRTTTNVFITRTLLSKATYRGWGRGGGIFEPANSQFIVWQERQGEIETHKRRHAAKCRGRIRTQAAEVRPEPTRFAHLCSGRPECPPRLEGLLFGLSVLRVLHPQGW